MSLAVDEPSLDMKEQLARIDRAQAETRKFAAEQNKLAEEATKLMQEARKLKRDRTLAPLALIVGVTSGVVGALLTRLLH